MLIGGYLEEKLMLSDINAGLSLYQLLKKSLVLA